MKVWASHMMVCGAGARGRLLGICEATRAGSSDGISTLVRRDTEKDLCLPLALCTQPRLDHVNRQQELLHQKMASQLDFLAPELWENLISEI